ncbi:hypothetical protein ACOMHN_059711 [Nucella lapillus]
MSTYRANRFTDFSETHSPQSESASEHRLSTHATHKHPHSAMNSKEQQTVSSNEHAVHEVTNRSVPIFLEPPPPLELHPMRLTGWDGVRPHTVGPERWDGVRTHTLGPERWDGVRTHTLGPERSLHRMDQELQRLAGEMNPLWTAPGLYPPHPLSRAPAWPLGDSDLTRLWNQSALEREAEVQQRLWNQSAAYRSPSVALPASFSPPEVPGGFVKLTVAPQTPWSLDAPWGAAAHAESWRQKENFFIDNPVVKGSDGQRQFRLEFDLRQFAAEEVEVRTAGHVLTVQAKHEESGDRKKAHREYFRQCTIPQGVDPRAILSRLSPSGILSVSAPLTIAAGETVKIMDTKPV